MKLGKWIWGGADERRVLMMGLDDAGKTTLLYRWIMDEVVTTIPTIGFNVETVKYPKGFAFTMWDVGGCDKIRPLYRHYFQNTQLIIFVHNCADSDRLDEQFDLLERSLQEDELSNVPVLIVFNKQDLLKEDEKGAVMKSVHDKYGSFATSCRRPAPVRIFECAGFSAVAEKNPRIVLDEAAKLIKEKDNGTFKKDEEKQVKESKAVSVKQELTNGERARAMADADDKTPNEFWDAFLDGSLAPWDHYHHLKAGFFVLIEGFEQGNGVLDAAETFIAHLERLRVGNPERFRNTTHRTMTIFWLAHLQVAAANFINSLDVARALHRQDFKDVLLRTPQLTDGRLWGEYYSKDRLFTQEAKDHWCLPDLKPLPSVANSPAREADKTSPTMVADADKLIRFALTVVQKTMSSKLRRGAVIKMALSTLMSATMRERTVNPAVAPYSETQAYFWIQIVHAALAAASENESTDGNGNGWNGSTDTLTLEAFKLLFGITGEEWRMYYSPKAWESISARMEFRLPDKKPLPNVISISDKSKVVAAKNAMVESYAGEKGTLSEMPSAKDLAVMAAVLCDEVEEGMGDEHGLMLRDLFDLLFANKAMREAGVATHKARSLAIIKALDLPCAGADGLTQRMFWVQQILVALGVFPGDNFEEFVRLNTHLAYKELPFVYYSPMVWASREAGEVFIGPDRKPMSSRIIV